MRLRAGFKNQVSKRGLDTLTAGIAAIGTPEQKKLCGILKILNEYECATRSAGVYYREPMKTIIEEMAKNKGVFSTAFMPGQSAGARAVASIIQLNIKRPPETELEADCLRRLQQALR